MNMVIRNSIKKHLHQYPFLCYANSQCAYDHGLIAMNENLCCSFITLYEKIQCF
jgi:hypothetical protein